MPPEHPARDMQDTLYLARPVAQHRGARPARASARGRRARPAGHAAAHAHLADADPLHGGARAAGAHRRLGKVFRRDNLGPDAHADVPPGRGAARRRGRDAGDLKGTLTAFVRELFAPDTQVLFRPSFFPYTEPSAEVFIGCVLCERQRLPGVQAHRLAGDPGSGMVHPAVFEAVGYDPERYTGFAFGMGIERVAMLKYGVDDIRLFYENDLRFLEQFPLLKLLFPGSVTSWTSPPPRATWRQAVDGRLRGGVDRRVPAAGRHAAGAGVGLAPSSPTPVIDFEITANRPDCLSVLGIAREVATAFDLPLRLPWDAAGRPISRSARRRRPARRRVTRRPHGHHRGRGAVPAICRGGRRRRRSRPRRPGWRTACCRRRPPDQQRRRRHQLRAARARPPDARVRSRAAGRTANCVRAARRPARRSRTLDGEERTLDADMLVIADADAPQAVAGVMGGAASEVWTGTRLVAFESAYFKPRRSAAPASAWA